VSETNEVAQSTSAQTYLQDEIELLRALLQVRLDQPRHLLSLRKERRCVELRDNLLEHFIHNRRQNLIVVVDANRRENMREL
jgi:hypothetical protein